MSQKVLWKIESLWEKYYKSQMCHSECISESSLVRSIEKVYKNKISIYNPDFHLVDSFDFSSSENIVHSDEYGKYRGLKKSQVLNLNGKLVYLFDNHNKIIQPFLEYFKSIEEAFDVAHIDAHDDGAIFSREKSQVLSLENVQTYINETRISDFFDFIYETKIINTVHRYTKSSDFETFKKPKNPYILSLDIDIFGPEGNFVDLESKIKIITEAWGEADVVCIAMSPGFIDQQYAQEIIKIFCK